MKHRIDIENEQEEVRLFRGYKTFLREVITRTLEAECFPYKAEVSVTLVTGDRIRELNAAYRKKDRETDVLSFPMLESFEEIAGQDLDEDAVVLGDVVVCPKVILSQSADFGTGFAGELALMVVHSVLHLLGYDHIHRDEKKEMFARQEIIFSALSDLLGADDKKEEK